MCNPMAIAAIGMVISVAGGIMQYQQAKDAQQAAKEAAAKEMELAELEEANRIKALEERMAQETDAAELQKLERQRQALREQAMIRVATSEAGALGGVQQRQLAASAIQTGMDIGVINTNLEYTAGQLEREKEAARIQMKTRINNAQASVPPAPSAFAYALGIGSSLASQYTTAYGAGIFKGGGGATTNPGFSTQSWGKYSTLVR